MQCLSLIHIYIGGTSVKLGLVDETGGILAKAEESVSFDGWQTPILTTVLAAAERFLTCLLYTSRCV